MLEFLRVGLIALLAVACGDDGTGGAPSDGAHSNVDALVQPLGGDVLGMWRELPSATDDAPSPIADRVTLTFDSNGGLVHKTGTLTRNYTYSIANGTLTIDMGASTVARPYVATTDRLLMSVLSSAGVVDGPIGTWQEDALYDGEQVQNTLELRADMTMSLLADYAAQADQVATGTWRQVGADLDVIAKPSNDHIYRTLYGGRLGEPYEKLP